MPNKQPLDLEKADKEVITYLELLLEKKGMAGLPSSILADMLMDLYARFDSFLILSILQGVSDEEYQKLNDFLETGPAPEESKKFLEENVANIQELVRNAMLEFEKVYLGEKS